MVTDSKTAIEMSDKVRSAIKDCLTRCYEGGTPIGVIAEFCAELRESGWDDTDIHHVEQAVRRVLSGVMNIEEATSQDDE